jgi:Pyruvate/2-oxoacid:ferredoxin oxidoreductase delta subunit
VPSTETEIEEIAKDAGADLVGFTNRARLADAPPSGDLTYVLPSAQSAIALAVSLDQEAAERYIAKEDMWAFNESHRRSYRKIEEASLAIQEYLEARGHEVATPYPNFEYREETRTRDMVPPLSHKYVCMAAGVGWIGWSGNLLTREYGALVTLGSVVTSAELTPSPMVEEDWCSNCKICVATCPTHYMPKQEEDVVEIGGVESHYSHRRSTMRCTVSCGGCNNVRKDTSKWSTWSPRVMPFMPGVREPDEAFDDRCDKDVATGDPADMRLQSMVGSGVTSVNSWEDVQRNMSSSLSVLTCSLCQVVCTPGLDSRKKNYRALVNSGRIEEGDPRLRHPTDRVKEWINPTLESIIAEFTPAAAPESDED